MAKKRWGFWECKRRIGVKTFSSDSALQSYLNDHEDCDVLHIETTGDGPEQVWKVVIQWIEEVDSHG